MKFLVLSLTVLVLILVLIVTFCVNSSSFDI